MSYYDEHMSEFGEGADVVEDKDLASGFGYVEEEETSDDRKKKLADDEADLDGEDSTIDDDLLDDDDGEIPAGIIDDAEEAE